MLLSMPFEAEGIARTIQIALVPSFPLTAILALLLLIAGLILFLDEVRLAVRATRIQDELLERD